MHRPTLLAGALTIVVICLYPPWAVTDLDAAQEDREDLTMHVFTPSQKQQAAKIMYRAVFMPSHWTRPGGARAYTAQIHTGRLLLQIVAAALIFGGLAYGIGPTRHNEAEVRAKVQGYDQTL